MPRVTVFRRARRVETRAVVAALALVAAVAIPLAVRAVAGRRRRRAARTVDLALADRNDRYAG